MSSCTDSSDEDVKMCRVCILSKVNKHLFQNDIIMRSKMLFLWFILISLYNYDIIWIIIQLKYVIPGD